jgi:hypothetical protein
MLKCTNVKEIKRVLHCKLDVKGKIKPGRCNNYCRLHGNRIKK